MEWLWWVPAAVAAASLLWLLAWLHASFWSARYRVPLGAQACHWVTCEDGWRIALHHYPGAANLKAHPVILCHGVGANASTFDLGPEASLARYLSGLGLDVWSLELRGFSERTKPTLFGPRSWDIAFDDFVDLDLPAAIAHVKAQTGAKQVHWVGHSMGGMVALCFAQGPHADALASLTAVGSPMSVEVGPLLKLGARLGGVLRLLRRLPLGVLSRLGIPGPLHHPLVKLFFRLAHVEPRKVREVMANMSCDIPASLGRQMCGWGLHGHILGVRGGRDFTDGLSKVHTPLLAIAGQDDSIAPPASVYASVQRVLSPRKAWISCGTPESGARAYGHVDLLLGRDVARDVFPKVAGWIASVAGLSLPGVEALEEHAPADAHKLEQPVVAEASALS